MVLASQWVRPCMSSEDIAGQDGAGLRSWPGLSDVQRVQIRRFVERSTQSLAGACWHPEEAPSTATSSLLALASRIAPTTE